VPIAPNTPARMEIVDLSRLNASAEDNTLKAQFNPTELAETLAVNWNKLAVLGFSHMPQQYQNTDNHGFSFELMFHATDASGRRLDDLVRARLFLLALCYPSKNTRGSPATGAPPRVMFFWPNLVSLTCVVKKLAIKHTMFNTQGSPVISQAKIDIEEIRDARLYADEVRLRGTMRGTGV
jgi:hypothetical protein